MIPKMISAASQTVVLAKSDRHRTVTDGFGPDELDSGDSDWTWGETRGVDWGGSGVGMGHSFTVTS